MHAIDILVVDNKSDLNVYMTAAEDGKSCCCAMEEKETCCQSPSSTCSYQDKTSLAGEARSMAAGTIISDFNEWAGTKIVDSAHWPILTVTRLIPSLCCQTSEEVSCAG